MKYYINELQSLGATRYDTREVECKSLTGAKISATRHAQFQSTYLTIENVFGCRLAYCYDGTWVDTPGHEVFEETYDYSFEPPENMQSEYDYDEGI